MRALVRDPPEGFVASHRQLDEGLEPERLEVAAGSVSSPEDGRAEGSLEITARIPDLGTTRWETTAALRRERGEWRLDWDPTTLHPELRTGDRFAIETNEVGRAPILARDGETEVAGPGEEGRRLLEPGFAQHVIGRVAEATAERLDELGDEYEPGDRAGTSGLEEAFEGRLADTEQIRAVLRSGEDGPVRTTLAERSQRPSSALTTTLDVEVQRALESALVGFEDREAGVVAIDAATGEIRAAASRPLGGPERALSRRATPGRAFALVGVAGLAADGAVPDAGELDEDEFRFEVARLGAEAWSDALRSLGGGLDPDLPIPAAGPSAPPTEGGAPTVAVVGGGAGVVTSPLHLASVVAAVVDGTWREPSLLAAEDPAATSGLAERTLSTGVPADLRGLLRDTAGDAFGDDRPPGEVLGLEAGPGEVAWFAGAVDDTTAFAVLLTDEDEPSAATALARRFVAELDPGPPPGD